MSTIIVSIIILVLAGAALHHIIKGKGNCGDCDCQCEIKEKMRHNKQKENQKLDRCELYPKSQTQKIQLLGSVQYCQVVSCLFRKQKENLTW